MVFDTQAPAAPYSLAGTWFMAGYKSVVFAVTARHVVRDCPVERLVLYPTNATAERLRISEWWPIADEEGDEDRADVFVASLEFRHLSRRARRSTRIIHLDPAGNAEWFTNRHTSMFFLCGYPIAINEADYDRSTAQTRQVLLAGNYVGPSITDGVHQLRVDNPLGVDFNGLSGSAVFAAPHELHQRTPPRFCGMALRGGAAASVVHFLESSVILQVLASAAARRLNRPTLARVEVKTG
jgi:hypothetical protein